MSSVGRYFRLPVLMRMGLGLLTLVLLTGLSFGRSKGPHAAEFSEIKTNLKAFQSVKKIAIVGVIEVLDDLRSGKQDFIYQKIPSQKLALRFNYLLPEGFTLVVRSAADISNMLDEQGLAVGNLLDIEQVATIGEGLGVDALLVGSYYSGTKNGYDVDVRSAIFVKLLDVKTGALIWATELDKKELQVPGSYSRVPSLAP